MLQRGAEQRLAWQEHHDHLGRGRRAAPSTPCCRACPCDRAPGARAPAASRPRVSSSGASCASRNASSGVFASTTICLPPGRWTIRSGRRRPLSPCSGGCSSKSQRRSIPAISTTRRSCISPQRPADRRRAQRARQRVGGRAERADLLGQPRIRLEPLALGLAELDVDLLQRVGNRLRRARRWPSAASRTGASPAVGILRTTSWRGRETRRGCCSARRPPATGTPRALLPRLRPHVHASI